MQCFFLSNKILSPHQNFSIAYTYKFYPDIIDAGFDILNPVQTSAAHMDPAELKREFGAGATFWGGGVDTQRVLPFGTPDEVRRDVGDRFRILAPGGGFVFNTIHNVQAGIPIENILALYQAVKECRDYPVEWSDLFGNCDLRLLYLPAPPFPE